MKKKLRTQCPTCHTTFALTRAELDARAGLVRCGHCSAVFHADQYLLVDPSPRRHEQRRTERAKPESAARKPRSRSKKKKQNKKKVNLQDTGYKYQRPRTSAEEFVSEEIAEVLTGKQRGRPQSVVWGLAALLLIAALIGQIVFFYASELARYPQFKPWVVRGCEWLQCRIWPRQNVELIELLRTSVAPHPKHANALRIRASMVNRADFIQPYPVMEITLTDTAGAVVARRTFAPHHYLKKKASSDSGMVPNIVVDALLDVSNPDPSPGGYEIRLLPR